MNPLFKPNEQKFLLHGADYNYEQWLDYPDVLEEDFRLMRLSKSNVMSVGIFSWAMLEPAEGEYQFEWLDALMDKLHANGLLANLATPSGARPAWMSHAYPEIRVVDAQGHREPHRLRHNHCPTSPVFREKTRQINTLLADRYKDHPALLMWHISNEFGNYNCHCELCYAAFQEWLKERYGTLDALNHAWWTRFWSHTFTDWSQIEPVDHSIDGLLLDWRRFITDQQIGVYLNESKPLREITPDVPVMTNFMLPDVRLDYWKFAEHVDIVTWDSYPLWHGHAEEWSVGVKASFIHDLNRSYKRQPFLLMESTPSVTNWQGISRPKKPGMHLLSSLQVVAHGGDGVQYFQWRKSRGGQEKFHGAVVGHIGGSETRVFKDVTAVGEHLKALPDVVGTANVAEVALLYDFQNEWALELTDLPRSKEVNYQDRCIAHYTPFWQAGVTVDLIDSSSTDLSPYKLVIVPMLYMLRDGIAERLGKFVEEGGTLVLTYLAGMVNESNLCFIGESPLRSLTGLWVEDTDVLFAHHNQHMAPVAENTLGLSGMYNVTHYADLMHLDTARPLATYGEDYYAGQPALTENLYGQGRCLYLGARPDARFLSDFYGALIDELALPRALETSLPTGVTVQRREGEGQAHLFVMNFEGTTQTVALNAEFSDALTDEPISGTLQLEPYGIRILCTPQAV